MDMDSKTALTAASRCLRRSSGRSALIPSLILARSKVRFESLNVALPVSSKIQALATLHC